ncbi:2-C-methyl-D-erythritol 4-phosphate cytidylyltransferase [Jatrophihabitans sp. DSM 45814]
MNIAAIVVAAGNGERLGAGVPKALVSLGGRPLYEWAAAAFLDHSDISSLVIVAPESVVAEVEQRLGGGVRVISGGATRQESVSRGLQTLPDEVEYVLVHDAARPLVPSSVISDVIAVLRGGARAVIPVLPVADTIKRVDPDGKVAATVDRAPLRSVQTPQGFQRAALVSAHAEAAALGDAGTTDDAGLLEAMGLEVMTVAGSELGFKITTAHDLKIAEALIQTVDVASAVKSEPAQAAGGGR